MSLMKDIHENNNLPGSVLAVLVALLLLLAGVVWVAFCIAVHRAALRIAEMKRQRRRQHILATALNRAASQPVPNLSTGIPMQFPGENSVNLSLGNLPTYEEALREQPPNYSKTMRGQTVSRTESGVRVYTNTGHLRVAPERPSSSLVSSTVDDSNPPSYEYAVSVINMEPNANTSQ